MLESKINKIINELVEKTRHLECVYGTHEYSDSTFKKGEFWADNENIICQIHRFIIEGKILQPTDSTRDGEQDSQLTIEIDPIYFDNYANCVGDFCLSPKMIISKITNQKLLIDIYDVEANDYEARYIPYYTEEYLLSDEDLSKFESRNQLINKYGQEYHARLTWIMYNCLKDMLYIVFVNNAAGSMWIEEVDMDTDWTYQQVGGSHANDVFESRNLEECEKYIKSEVEATTRFAVFQGKDENGNPYYFYEKIDCTSGTYQEVGGDYSNFITDFIEEEDAKNYCRKDSVVSINKN